MAKKPLSAEIHPGVGFRIKHEVSRPNKKLVESFRKFESPDISDQLNRLYALVPEIDCLTGSHHSLVGSVCTVKVYPGDNLMVHKVLDVAMPGDVVVVDARASTTNAVLGGLISLKAKTRKIAGFVVDGFIRDLPEILPLDFPVFARGTTPVGPLLMRWLIITASRRPHSCGRCSRSGDRSLQRLPRPRWAPSSMLSIACSCPGVT